MGDRRGWPQCSVWQQTCSPLTELQRPNRRGPPRYRRDPVVQVIHQGTRPANSIQWPVLPGRCASGQAELGSSKRCLLSHATPPPVPGRTQTPWSGGDLLGPPNSS